MLDLQDEVGDKLIKEQPEISDPSAQSGPESANWQNGQHTVRPREVVREDVGREVRQTEFELQARASIANIIKTEKVKPSAQSPRIYVIYHRDLYEFAVTRQAQRRADGPVLLSIDQVGFTPANSGEVPDATDPAIINIMEVLVNLPQNQKYFILQGR